MHDNMELVYAQNREEWRAWLQEHYQSKKEIGLVYYKKGTKMPSIEYEESVEEALCFGWVDGIRKGMDDTRYFLRFTPRKPKSMWSLVNKERVEALIEAGLMTEEGMRTVREAKESGQWDMAYTLKGENEIPEDFKAALELNPVAYDFFKKLSNSNKFIYINRVNKLKTAAKREERIRLHIEALLKGIKTPA